MRRGLFVFMLATAFVVACSDDTTAPGDKDLGGKDGIGAPPA